MHDLLSEHVRWFCDFYKIRDYEDFRNVPVRSVSELATEVRLNLQRMKQFSIVGQHHWMSASAAAFDLWHEARRLIGVTIVVARIAPIFYTEWLPKEGWDRPLDFNVATAREFLESKVYQRYKAALKKPVPSATRKFHEKVLSAMAAAGLIHVTPSELRRCPSGRKIPKFLRDRNFNFFYFHSIPLAYLDQVQGVKVKTS